MSMKVILLSGLRPLENKLKPFVHILKCQEPSIFLTYFVTIDTLQNEALRPLLN